MKRSFTHDVALVIIKALVVIFSIIALIFISIALIEVETGISDGTTD
jgi:hypothetical protein